MDLDDERVSLAKAEDDITAGERRVSALEMRVERLRRDGRGTKDAEDLLQTFQQTLSAWRGHREEILRHIARLEAKARP
ncbi:MAG TPA: hypothetical protein VE650_05845 [Acetobacteraceae bacterium]|nr:hypothetical protein [Acetobacteraceae bacterium]